MHRLDMHLLKWSAIAFVTLATPSLADDTAYVLGDSIGEGVAIASRLKSLAKISIHIRGPKAIAQINQTPPGATVFMVLGTNDAEGGLRNIDKCIDDVVAAAGRRQLNVIWIGPHCVRKSWDTRARELDEILRTRLAKTQVRYVSMRDERLCAGRFHEPDGIHLTMSGYNYMWEKVRLGAGFSAAGTRDAAPVAVLAAPAAEGNAGATHRMVMEIHVPPAGPSTPLVWVRVGD
jgi:hypothetical protein